MKIIAVEEHFTTKEHLDARGSMDMGGGGSAGAGDVSTYTDGLLEVGEGRLKIMDEAGINMQVLSLTIPGVQMLDVATGVALARKTNDKLSEIIGKYPERFAGLATVPPQAPDEAAKELERAVLKLGLKGAIINSHVKGEYLDDRKYWAIFQAAEKLDVPIYIHPQMPSPDLIKPYLAYPGLSAAFWGFGAEVGLHTARLICSGVFDEYPRLKIIIGHMGEALPYWLWRMDNFWRRGPLAKLKKPSICMQENISITTSGMFWPPALMCAYLALGADRILFAVDHPYESSKEAVQFINSVPICDSDKEKICHLNAEKLLRL